MLKPRRTRRARRFFKKNLRVLRGLNLCLLILLGSISVFAQSNEGIIATVAGNTKPGFSGDGGRATSASLNSPIDITVDSAGNLFILDSANNRVRRVDATTGIITTVAGNGEEGFNGDGNSAI